jgi:LDH2 family malate/lactate/ureidoglycolate dehydrogenase
MNVTGANLREQIIVVLRAWGINAKAAEISAEIMADTDLAGIESHGVGMLKVYEEWMMQGQLNRNASPRVIRETAATALIDGDAGLGHAVGVDAMALAIRKARVAGVGVVSVFNSGHFGAAGFYARLAANEGCLGMAMTTTRLAAVTPTHASTRLLGTNPIAFAAPAARNRPFVLDMSTSTAAVNKLKSYALRNKPLPPGWFLDGAGRPVTDASVAVDLLVNRSEGGLSPIGGTPEMASHKGYGLGVMVQILAGTLGGSVFTPIRKRTQKPDEPDDIGHFFMAIDPRAFRDAGEFERDLDETIDELHQAERARADQPVLVAGDPESSHREQCARSGIPIPDALAHQVKAICDRCGAPFTLRPIEDHSG